MAITIQSIFNNTVNNMAPRGIPEQCSKCSKPFTGSDAREFPARCPECKQKVRERLKEFEDLVEKFANDQATRDEVLLMERDLSADKSIGMLDINNIYLRVESRRKSIPGSLAATIITGATPKRRTDADELSEHNYRGTKLDNE